MEPPEAAGDGAKGEPSGLGHTLRATFVQAYDHIFLVMGGSLLWAVSLALPALSSALVAGTPLALPAYYLLGAFSVGPAWIGLYGLSANIARRELPGIGDFFRTLRRFYWRAVALFLVQVFIGGGIALSVWFYQARFDYWLLEAISILWLYVGLFWVMVGLYAPAFLVRDEGSVWSALRKGALLTLAHPGYSFLILLQVLFLLLVIAVPILGRVNVALGVSFILFFFLLPGFAALLSTNAVNDLLRAHMARTEDEEKG